MTFPFSWALDRTSTSTSFVFIYRLHFVFTMNYPMQRFLETYLLLVEGTLVNSLQGALSKIKFLFFFSTFKKLHLSACVPCLRTWAWAIETAHWSQDYIHFTSLELEKICIYLPRFHLPLAARLFPAPWSDSRQLLKKWDICCDLSFMNRTPYKAWRCALKHYPTRQIQRI